VNQYDYKVLGEEEALDGNACWKIEVEAAQSEEFAVHARVSVGREGKPCDPQDGELSE